MIHPTCFIDNAEFLGPIFTQRECYFRDCTIRRYCGFSDRAYVRQAEMGPFCCVGAYAAVNPAQHPLHQLSVHNFGWCNDPAVFDGSEWRENNIHMDSPASFTPRITLGADCWLGRGCVVMANLGNGVVVGANAVVTHPVEDFAIVAGAPAKIVNYRFDRDTRARLNASKWWERDLQCLRGLPLRDINRCLDQMGV